MNAKSTRLLKEARALFWPWCAVTIAGVLLLFQHQSPSRENISMFYYVGIPLLATLSLGNEFQHRTLSLLLSQPVSRLEIWGEKLSVTFVAVLSATIVFCYAWRSVLQQDPKLWVFVGVFVITTIAPATFWTLLARSTLGGVALNGFSLSAFAFIVMHWEEILGPNYSPARSITALWTVAFAALCFAGVMLWLGGRKLARFEVTGGMAGDDLLMAGPSLMPEAWAGLFRCRPAGPFLNLIRKELRLLRPLWLLTLLVVLYLTCLTVFRLMPERESYAPRAMAPVAPFWAALLLIPILAGSLSLGEERTSGTQSWHMTLPVSARRQWLIKLVMAMFAGIVCAVMIPTIICGLLQPSIPPAGWVMTASGPIYGSPFMFVDPKVMLGWLLTVLALSFASFWCACAVNGTVRAALWVFPAMGALLLAGRFGPWVAQELLDLVVSRFDPFVDFRFTNAVSNIQLYGIAAMPTLVVTLLVVPTLLFAVLQSYRLFPAQHQDSTLSVMRYLLPLAISALLCSFSLRASFLFVDHAKQQIWTMFRETHEAIEKIQPGTAKLDAAHPLQLTVEDLAKASPLSERTRRWLGNASITVAPDKPHPGGYCCGGNSRGTTFVPDKAYFWYLATIHRPGGADCTISFQAGGGYGTLGGVCE